MNDQQLVTIAKALRVMAGYGSRESRIATLLNNDDLDVAMLAQILRAHGLLTPTSLRVSAIKQFTRKA